MTNQDLPKSEAAGKPDEQWWLAIGRQIGTNDRLEVTGPTRQHVDNLLFRRLYPAEHGSVRYFCIDPPAGRDDA